MKDFFDTWKFKILVAVAVFLVGIMAYAGANGRLTAAPQELLGVVLMPFQKVTSALSGGIGSVWEKYTSIDEVLECLFFFGNFFLAHRLLGEGG